MILDTATAVEPAPATQQDTLELLLQDRDWVAARFSEIMTASGFGDRVIVGTLPRLPRDRGEPAEGEMLRWHELIRLPRTGIGGRVRSPPGR